MRLFDIYSTDLAHKPKSDHKAVKLTFLQRGRIQISKKKDRSLHCSTVVIEFFETKVWLPDKPLGQTLETLEIQTKVEW